MNQVYSCGTYFQVYVSILKVIQVRGTGTRSMLILNDHTPQIETLIPLLQENQYFDFHLFVPFRKIEENAKRNRGVLGKTILRNQIAIQSVEANSSIGDFEEFLRTSEFNLFYMWGFPSAYFILKYPTNYFRLIEDGLRNYALKTSWFKHWKRKYILRTFIGDGFDDAVKEIQVQYPHKLSPRVRQKGTILELRRMQADLDLADRNRILNAFMRNQVLPALGSKSLLIITQPFSEEGFMSEEDKIRMYAHMIEGFSSSYQVYLKPHPRELTDYKSILTSTFVEIPRAFPLEMLDLLDGIYFEQAITLDSSAINNLQCIRHKIQLGRSYLRKITAPEVVNPGALEKDRMTIDSLSSEFKGGSR